MPRKPNQRKEYTAHYNRLELYAALVDNIYKQATDEFTKLAFSVNHDPIKAFKWSDYPQTKRRVDRILRGVSDKVQGVVVNGVTAEWEESNFKNDLLARSVIGIKQFDKDDKGRDIIPERFKPYFNNNADALRSFVDRKQKGLNLSQKVWKLSEQYKSDLELALSVGLSDGRSAVELSRDIRTYLKEPAKLFRRVRSENGSLQLSKAAKAYHPGAGTYRSSYKNAMRLTRTEINMAYRTADNVRWGKLDFVVGFEVKRSGRGYDCSVCESLAGKYPKDFKFVGWHPHCRCYVIPILKTDEEFWAWDGRSEAPTASINEVKDVPQGYKSFIAKNRDRISVAKKNNTLPYFLRDNSKYVNNTHFNFNEASTHNFTPAKTIDEFTKRMQNVGVGQIDIAGISVEDANTVLSVFEDVGSRNGIDIGEVIFRSNISNRAYYVPTKDIAHRRLVINANIFRQDVYKEAIPFKDQIKKLKNSKNSRLQSIQGYQSRLGQNAKADKIWGKAIKDDERKIRDLEMKIRGLDKYIKSGILSRPENITSTVKGIRGQAQATLRHELGHYIDDILRIDDLPSFLRDKSVSLYGETDIKEYFAEWFSYYKLKGTTGIPNDVMKWITIWENK